MNVAIFFAGVATATLTILRTERSRVDPSALDEVKKSVANVEARFQSAQSANVARMDEIETRLAAHSAALADVPSTSQIIAAMEQLLSRTMSSLDERLAGQARSIDVLKTTVSQTDSLLLRVLESLDTLQSASDSAEFGDPLVSRPAV
jgi:hypothetical protein